MPKTKRYRYRFNLNTPSWPVRPSSCHQCRTLHDDSVAVHTITKPRPSLAWHKTENQRFVDPSRYPADHPLDGDDGNSSEENDDDEEIQGGLDEAVTDNEDDTTRQEAAEAEADARVGTVVATPTPGQEQEHNPATISSHETKLEEDAVLRFLDVVEDHAAHCAAVQRLRDFFDDASLKQLNKDREGVEGITGCRTVLDDRNFTSRLYRHYQRPLSPIEVYEKLTEKRFPQAYCSSVHRPSTSPWIESTECDIERRTIYTSNPDKWLALALIATASPSQAPVLFDFIAKYLNHKPSMGVQFEKRSLSRMNLFAHLASSTLRYDECLDHRKLAGDQYLRRSVEVPHMKSLRALMPTSKSPIGRIYETQISIHISIIDQSCWTAYVFEDTFYKRGKEAKSLNRFLRGSSSFSPDALAGAAGSGGELDSTLFEAPMEYFLTRFEARIEQSCLAWDKIVEELEKNVKCHRPGIILKLNARLHRSKRRHIEAQLPEEYSQWISDMMSLCFDLATQTSTTIMEWDGFKQECLQIFPKDTFSPLNTSIGQTVNSIRVLKHRLDALIKELERDQSTLSSHLEVENNGTAKIVKLLTLVTIVFMPAMLNLGLFNIPQGIMPFPMNTNAFVASFFALAFIVALVWGIVFHLNTVTDFLTTSLYIVKVVWSSMDGVFQGYFLARRKLLDTHSGDSAGEQTGRDQRDIQTAASTTSKTAWALRLKSRLRFGGRRTQKVQGEPV